MQHVEARAGAYADSVTLMQVTAQAQAVAGVQAALVAMGTELNLDLLAGLGLAAPDKAGPNDLLVAITADDGESLASALAVVDSALSARPAEQAAGQEEQPPRTTVSAARRTGPGLALVSVPGQYALAEAVDALEAGCDVMIFSDNVPVEQEIWLKDLAAERDLLVLGPDCGTAIVRGVGLGFSHSVPTGQVGLVAASGTGAQQVICLLDAAGAGVSAVLGVGGRDLSAAVGGRSARAALAALDADPGTELIVLLSKPPADHVAAELRQYADGLTTPVQFALIGPGQPDLTAAAEAALRGIGQPVPEWPSWPPVPAGGRQAGRNGAGAPRGRPPGRAPRGAPGGRPPGPAVRGLFAGGTLCDEAMVIAAERLGPVYSNIPLHPEWRLDPRRPGAGHTMIDFGADELTAGRPHPMIDQRLRLERLAAEAADSAVAVILMDVVLGYGAHPNPAAELAPTIAAALAERESGDLAVVVSLIGAKSDPQGLAGQATALADAGAHVFASNAQAARFASELVTGDRA
ncbi:MAG: FdrA family protein [Streptosporangiaceae bacterium]